MTPIEDFTGTPIIYKDATYYPVSIESIRVETAPEFSIYFRPGKGQPFVLYCERRTMFTEEARARLVDNNIKELYILENDHLAYRRYLTGHLEDILHDGTLSVHEKSVIIYDAAQAVVEDILENPVVRGNLRRGREIVHHTVDFMTGEDFLLEHMLRTISCDYYLYTHSVNVVAYSIALAMVSGYKDPATLREIANGALLHDVGKSGMNPELLYKEGPLTPSELEEMQMHPRKGYDQIHGVCAVGEIAHDIILHHHEKLDGSGYPDRLSGARISPFVRIVTIADVFDAITSERYHQRAQTSFEAIRIMNTTMNEQLDRDLLRAFIRMMSAPKKF